jgi:hypothetical protein
MKALRQNLTPERAKQHLKLMSHCAKIINGIPLWQSTYEYIINEPKQKINYQLQDVASAPETGKYTSASPMTIKWKQL